MQRANINDRNSVERIYPRAVFERDANANMRAKATVLSGVTIASMPDADGAFELTRAALHAGEAAESASAIFLCPFAQETGHGKDYPATPSPPAATGDPGDSYDAFIEKIIATAREADLNPASGRGDKRLRGLRQ